jgi:hypothetical protein
VTEKPGEKPSTGRTSAREKSEGVQTRGRQKDEEGTTRERNELHERQHTNLATNGTDKPRASPTEHKRRPKKKG